MTEVNRHISFYEKHGDKYIGEIPLNNVALNDLLSLVSIEKYKDDYLLYNCYLLDKAMLDKLAFSRSEAVLVVSKLQQSIV